MEEKGLLFRLITVTRVLSFEELPLDDDGWGDTREARRSAAIEAVAERVLA